MGRNVKSPEGDKGLRVQVCLTPVAVENLDFLAELEKCSRSEVIERFARGKLMTAEARYQLGES